MMTEKQIKDEIVMLLNRQYIAMAAGDLEHARLIGLEIKAARLRLRQARVIKVSE